MEITTTTNRSSKFYLPLDGPAEIGESDLVEFVKKDTLTLKKEPDISGFNLEILLHATPDVMAQIIIDKNRRRSECARTRRSHSKCKHTWQIRNDR